MNAIEILEKCIKELESMSQEEFERRLKEKGLDKKTYDVEEYTDENMTIIF